MPAYNHERFVGAAVESVLNQSLRDLELVVVDDGSTDRTADVIRGYDDDRIRYHYQENQDAFNALNRGLELAAGRCCSVLNSDDIYHPERLARCVDAAKGGRHPDDERQRRQNHQHRRDGLLQDVLADGVHKALWCKRAQSSREDSAPPARCATCYNGGFSALTIAARRGVRLHSWPNRDLLRAEFRCATGP